MNGSENGSMKKFFFKTLFLAICSLVLAFSAFAQKPSKPKPPKSNKKDPPRIVVRPKHKPKGDKKKRKKPMFAEYVVFREDE